jgi:hypothetical protein
VPRKSDAAEIALFFDELPGDLRLDARRAWWPQFVYRFDDVRSVASILQRGAVLSREQCDREGIEHHDAANQAIIEATPYAHRYVRLFFRPLTPTQFHMEGIKAAADLSATKEHCPVPVFLLFDSGGLLGEQGVQFSDGGIARRSRYRVGRSAEFLQTIPFESVYHDGPLPDDPSERSDIIFRRHAEVLIENEVDLRFLKHIRCRTGPERDTLLYLLGDAAPRYSALIRIAPPGAAIFYRQGMFVETVHMLRDRLYFRMANRGRRLYDADLLVSDSTTGEELARHTRREAQLNGTWDVPIPKPRDRVLVTFIVEGAVAFQGHVTQQAVFGA